MCDTMRVPGFIRRSCGRSCWFSSGNRYIVTTLACEKSSLKMSPVTIFTRSATPARSALRRASCARSGSYSMPVAVAPNAFAAAIGIRPSPAPRSTTWSRAVTFAASSMRVTIASGVGSHITSLPCWRSLGRYSASPYCGKSCAGAQVTAATSAIANQRTGGRPILPMRIGGENRTSTSDLPAAHDDDG